MRSGAPLFLLLGWAAVGHAAPPAAGPEIRIEASGTLSLDGVRVTPAELAAALTAARLDSGATPEVSAAPEAPWGVVWPAYMATLAAGDAAATLRTDAQDDHGRLLEGPAFRTPRAGDLPRTGPERVILTVEVHRDGLQFFRRLPDDAFVAVGASDNRLAALERLAAEDRRLHPGGRLVVLAVDTDVDYGEVLTALDRLRTHGYRVFLSAATPGSRTPDVPVVGTRALMVPEAVALHASGDATLTWPGGHLDTLEHAAVQSYEAHCDTSGCDLVANTARRRVRLGVAPAALASGDPVFSRPVAAVVGRLPGPAPRQTGDIRPLVQLPGEELTAADGAAWFVERASDAEQAAYEAELLRADEPVDACAARARTRGLDGSLLLHLTVWPGGGAPGVTVDTSTVDDPEFSACALTALQSLRFPEHGARVVFSAQYPVELGGDGP